MKKTLLFIATIFAVSLNAQTFTDGDYTYEVKSGNAYITATTATGVVTFPTSATDSSDSSVYTVTGVETAFNGSTRGASDLTEITIPTGYIEFEASCFRGATSLTKITFNSGEVFGGKLFRNVKTLKDVVLPNTITTWGTEIFSQSGLETISLGNVPEINNRMFRDTQVVELTIPASVTTFSAGAWNNSKVVTLIVEATTPPVISLDDPLTEKVNEDWAGTAANITAYVPDAQLATYQATAIWEDMTLLAASTNTTLSTSTVEQNINVSVYPNPATDVVSLENAPENLISITIYDLTGKALSSTTEAQVNISNLSQGVYILKGKTANGEFVRRVIKK